MALLCCPLAATEHGIKTFSVVVDRPEAEYAIDVCGTMDRHEPLLKESKSRINRLRGLRRSGYRLRVGDVRVFYDVSERTVEILAIILKSEAISWLESIEESP